MLAFQSGYAVAAVCLACALSTPLYCCQTIEGVSYSVLPVPWRLPIHTEMEMVVPAESAEQVLMEWEALTELLPEHAKSNFVAEIRFSAADDIWLSNAYGRDVCHVTVGRFYPTETDIKAYFRCACIFLNY